MSNKDSITPRVIIIGAGAAGISAASKLYQNGIKNIIILEGEDRIGGRINSIKFQNTYIDLGAQWCHGKKGNVVYEMVKDLNFLIEDDLKPDLLHSTSTIIDEKFKNQFFDVYNNLLAVRVSSPVSLGEFLTDGFEKNMKDTWAEESERELGRDCLEWLRKWILTYEGAFSWLYVSTNKDYEQCEGMWRLSWNGLGYKTILDMLMQIPKSNELSPISEKIVLNKIVSKIIWRNPKIPSQATIVCTDNTQYTADHVIVTISLGVLKKYHKSLFVPTLPIKKITAIESLGFDAIGKLFFHFPNVWWDENFGNACFVWGKTDLETSAEDYSYGPTKDGISWITAIFTIHIVPEHPNILLARVSGEFVPEIEQCDDETITNGMMYVLTKFLGKKFSNLSRPDRLIRYNWYSSPHFCGSYSFQTLNSQRLGQSQEIVLSEPLLTDDSKPILQFAGEATHPKYYSTVHGAIETGFREADRLINFYK